MKLPIASVRSVLGPLRPYLRPIAYGLAIMLCLIALLLALVLSRAPAFQPRMTNHQENLSRTKTILRDTVPNNMRVVVRKMVALTADDLETIANYALSSRKVPGFAEVSIRDNRLRMRAAIKLPWNTANLYLNLRVIADDAAPSLVVQQLKIGRLAIPHPLIGWILKGMTHSSSLERYVRMSEEVVREVRIVDDRLRVDFDWNREALAQADDLVTDFAMKERLLAYQRQLVEVVNRPELKRYVRLAALMQPLFALAQIRSEKDQEPTEENRALIMVLNAYVNGPGVTTMVDGHAHDVPVPRKLALLNRRVDTAQHFITSAALVVSGTRTLADVVGLAKEINDAHSGSGFSFTDLAANRAGVNFGKFAVKSEETARRLQARLSQIADETLFMPSIKDLPENLKTEEFEQRFKTIDSAEFSEVKRIIEARIAACPIYQN